MEYLTNSTNLEAFKEAVAKAKERILICSAWVRSETLKKVFEGLSREALPPVKILMRMGGSGDYQYTDIDPVLGFARELGAEVRYLPNLHAKINVVDGFFATVGSFNLTGGGYGDASRSGTNDEVGILIDDSAKVNELAGIFEDLWDRAFTVGDEVLGLTLSDGTHRWVGYIGTKEVERGRFVEIEAEDYEGHKRRWLGRVEVPLAHHTALVSELTGDANTDNERFKGFIDALTTKEPASRALKVITLNGELPYPHLRSGKIEILKEIVDQDHLSFNRVPIPGAAVVKEADANLLKKLYCPDGSEPIGVLVSNPQVEVGLNYNEILTKHMSIFGTTGSGKSFFAKRFLVGFYHWLVERENGRIVVIDTHDEYSKDNPDFPERLKEVATYIDANKIRQVLSKRVVGGPDEGTDFKDIFGVSFSSDENSVLRDAYREAKKKDEEAEKIRAFLSFIEEFTVSEEEKDAKVGNTKVIEGLKAIFEEVVDDKTLEDFLVNELFDSVAETKVKAEGESLRTNKGKELKREILKECLDKLKEDTDVFQNLMERIRESRLNSLISAYSLKIRPVFDPDKSRRIKEAFDQGRVGFERADAVELIKDPGFYVLNLRNLASDEERSTTVGAFLQSIFDRARAEKGNFKTLVVVEEAHNYAPEKVASASKGIMRRIASEGRKFNLGLMVITQRSAYIAKDVIAQCNSSAIFRLVNSQDIGAIESTVEAISDKLLEDLPVFDTGQCIVTGVSIYQPVTVRVSSE